MNKILVMETFGFNLYFDEKNKGRSKDRQKTCAKVGFLGFFLNADERKHLSSVKRQSYDLEHRQGKVLQKYLYMGDSGQASLLVKKN